jgi:hypothetical protein
MHSTAYALTAARHGLPFGVVILISILADDLAASARAHAALMVGGLQPHGTPRLTDDPTQIAIDAAGVCTCWGEPAQLGDTVAAIGIDLPPEDLDHADLLGLADDILAGRLPLAEIADMPDDDADATDQKPPDDDATAAADDTGSSPTTAPADPQPAPRPRRRARRAPPPATAPADEDELTPAMPGTKPPLY